MRVLMPALVLLLVCLLIYGIFAGDFARGFVFLFEPRFGDPVGSCREHTIHWDQDASVCARLRESAAVKSRGEHAVRLLRGPTQLLALEGPHGGNVTLDDVSR